MRNLIIIGNGFDLAHELKTSYFHFRTAIENHPEEYGAQRNSNNYLLIRLLKKNDLLWSDIEVTYFDILTHIHDNSYLQKNHSPTNAYKNVESLNKDFEEIKKYLSNYLLEQQKEFNQIENYKNFFQEFNNKETVIINFNYTNTVVKYIENTDIKLIHIHGQLEKESNPMIFGYAASHEESKNLLIENNNNYVKNIKKFNYLFTNNDTIIKEHLKRGEYNVFILGHSCGISDSLILNEIFNSEKIHQIIPFYFMNKDGYFDTMVNIDRIIDDYSKLEKDNKAFSKLISFTNSYKMPQIENDIALLPYLKKILNKVLPNDYTPIG